MIINDRSSLWAYHNWILQYDGQGGYVFTKLDAKTRLSLQEEKIALEFELIKIPDIEKRLAELKLLKETKDEMLSQTQNGGFLNAILSSLKRNKSKSQLNLSTES